MKTSNLSVSKVRQFLHSKYSYTKSILAKRKFKQRKAFARFKKEVWCLDLAYVDKLAKKNNGVKYLLVRHDLFDGTVDAKGMRTEDSEESVSAFLTTATKTIRPKKIWFDKGKEVAEEFEKLCKVEVIGNYSTMSETKAAFAEPALRSLENSLYRYMKHKRYKYFHSLTQFLSTLTSRRNCAIDFIPRNVKNSDFLSILYSKPLRDFEKTKFKIGNKARIPKYDLPFRRGYNPPYSQKVSDIVAVSSRKPPTYTIKDEQDEIYPR